VRESAQSWRELLIDVKQRGLEIAPDLAVGDGALGFWKAIEQIFPSTRHQRYRRALGSSAHVKPNRERVRDGASSNREDERSPVGEDSQAYGVQTRQRRRKNMATIEGRKSVAESRPRHQIPKRHRGHQNVGSPRRLIDLITQS